MAKLQPSFSKVRRETDPADVNNFIEQQWPGIIEEEMFKTLEKAM